MERAVALSLPAEPGAVAQARRLVESVSDLPPAHVVDAQLVISELVTNALQHAELDAGATIVVSMQRERDRYRIVVDDHGSFTARAGDELPGHPRGGRGLAIVDALCVTWEANKGLVVAWMAI
jgi:anti-sigma regulatory factor (Ser/Thr protein kinase)